MADKRILLVRSDIRMAGPGMLMLAIADALNTLGWHVEIASSGGSLAERFAAEGYVHHVVPGLAVGGRSPRSMVAGARALRSIVRKSRITIVHSFNAQAGLLSWSATCGLRVKLINTVLGAGMERFLPYMPFDLIAVSKFVEDNLSDHGVARDRMHLVYNGVIPDHRILPDDDAFDALWDERDQASPFEFLGIAMMYGDKGHRSSIEAIARLTERFPNLDVKLSLIGDGDLRASLQDFAQERGVSGKIKFLGARDDVFGYLDRASAFLHLSPQETFGIVLAEAGARGLPAIAYSIGGIPEVSPNGQSGILAPLHDIDAVVDAMAELAQDRRRAREMGREGLNRTRALFSRPRLGQRLEEVYAAL